MHTFLDMQYIGFAFAISFSVPKVLEPCKAWLLPEQFQRCPRVFP